MGKFKMPTVQQFLQKKIIYGPRKDPVWVYLEKEMMQNIDKKPYNEKVGSWLRFLRDLRYYFFCEAKRKLKRLEHEAGPPWYCELSISQRKVLSQLKANIHQDLLEDLPIRIRKSLSDLGVTLKFPKPVLMKAMNESVEDAGVFIWNLFTAYYKKPPCYLRPSYDFNAMILMSSLVFIDLEECIETLVKTMSKKQPPPKEKKLKRKKYTQPKCKYGEYLQQMYVPLYSPHSSGKKKKPDKVTLGYKFRLRSEESYDKLIKNLSFLEKRKERNKKEQQSERICKYKFWEPPSTLRNTDPKMVAYVNKLKMFKRKAKAKHTSKMPYKNQQYHVGGVSFSGGRPNFMLQNVALLPTGYIPIHGGIVDMNGEMITTINGFWKFPRDVQEKCDDTCDCITIWENSVMDFLQKSKCKCGHLYDFYNEGQSKEKYFYQPNRHGGFWVDRAKIYQLDPKEDFIKDTVRDALKSADTTPDAPTPTVSATALKEKELLGGLLADISDTPLLIPHLPQANLLNNLQEWVRARVKGKLLPKQHKQFMYKTQRRWLDLKHMDFRARAYRIPFTQKQLHNLNWSHRKLIQILFNILLEDFATRNRILQLNQTRLWWSTMKYDAYASKPFFFYSEDGYGKNQSNFRITVQRVLHPWQFCTILPLVFRDIYFTYMPGRLKDTFLINPYSSECTPKYGAKTCPLD